MPGTKSITNTNSFKFHTISRRSTGTIISHILYWRKPKHREDKWTCSSGGARIQTQTAWLPTESMLLKDNVMLPLIII